MNWNATGKTCSISAASCRATSAICWSPGWRARTRDWWLPARRSARNSPPSPAPFPKKTSRGTCNSRSICFKDLQFSLQPRFHLEIGLVRLVQAGRLLPIEQALAGLAGSERSERTAPPTRTRRGAVTASAARAAAASPRPRATSPRPAQPALRRSNWIAPRRPAHGRRSRSPQAPARSRCKPKRPR